MTWASGKEKPEKMDKCKDERLRRAKGGSTDELQKALVAFINSLFSLLCENIDSSFGLIHVCGEGGRGLYSISEPQQ